MARSPHCHASRLAIIALMAWGTAFAAIPQGSAERPAPLDAEDLGAFFGGLAPYAIRKSDIAGFAIAVVKDGRVIFEKGYGFADVVRGQRMSPTQTLIRPGSITKLFTFTAVMQLVERGKLDLNRDVNAYLDFKISEPFGRPITLIDLMTHTAGFEESEKDVFVAHPSELMTLRDYVQRNVPHCVEPPGTVVAYSNYGAALAGYIVERVSGVPYADYVRENILNPLRMENTTFAQPLPLALAERVSKGYLTASSRHAMPFELVGATPAGALTSTVDDLTHFAIAHLQDGEYAGTRILQTQTARLMHATAFQSAVGLNGYALGFYEESRNGLRIYGHGGDTELFHSDIHLIPGDHVAVVMSFNSNGKDGEVEAVRTAMFRQFLDRYFPYRAVQRPTWPGAREDALRVAGPYVLSRRSTSSFMSLLTIFQQPTVRVDRDGLIEFSFFTGLDGVPKRWREIGPLLYQDESGKGLLKFVTAADGAIRYFISDDFIPVFVFERAPAWQKGVTVLPALIAALIILALASILWPALAIIRRRRGKDFRLTRSLRVLRIGTRLGAIANLGVLLAWLLLIVSASNTIGMLSDTLDPTLTLLYLVGWVAIVLALVGLWNAAAVWLGTSRAISERIAATLLAAAMAFSAWFLIAYHLIDFIYRY